MLRKEKSQAHMGWALAYLVILSILGCGGASDRSQETAMAPSEDGVEAKPDPDSFVVSETVGPPNVPKARDELPEMSAPAAIAVDPPAVDPPAVEPSIRSDLEHLVHSNRMEEEIVRATVEEPDPGVHSVDVFYATDRRPLDKSASRLDLTVYAIPMVALLVTILLGGAAKWLHRPLSLGFLTVISAIMTAQLIHSAIIQNQKERRWETNEGRIYGSDRHETARGYELEVGVCQVSIPPNHEVGKVELPAMYRFEFRENPEHHVILVSVTAQAEHEFYDALEKRIRQSPNQQAFIFIHGYNVSFEDAIQRTAQIAYDLRFHGVPICYSWPSKAGLAEYTRDEANIAWTMLHLEDFLNQMVQQSSARTIHLIAHSMGNRALLQALERMALKQHSLNPMPDSPMPDSPMPDSPMLSQRLFGQLIMAAPDVDAAQFRDRYAPVVARMVRQVTLYASSNDQALVASTKVHGYSRAGLSGSSLVVVPGIDTIDVSPIDTSLIGHSYYGDNPQLIEDLHALVELSTPASGRPWLKRITNSTRLAYWIFRP